MLEHLRLAFREMRKDHVDQLGAAIAFFSAFSVAPLMIIATSIAGFVLGEDVVRERIFVEIHRALGPEVVLYVQRVIENSFQPEQNVFAVVSGVVILLVISIGLFNNLQTAMDLIFKAPPKKEKQWLLFLGDNILSFVLVLSTGLLLFATVLVDTVLTFIGDYVTEVVPFNIGTAFFLDSLLSFGLTVFIFSVFYRVLPAIKLSWRYILPGALFTAVLFEIGKYLITLFFGLSRIATIYGVAGSLVLLLFFLFFSAQIFLFGAEFIKVLAGIAPEQQSRWYYLKKLIGIS